jgi:hypothetical protein
LAGRIGGYAVHAKHGDTAKPAREAFQARFAQEVDPNGLLPLAERERRAEQAKKAYFTKLALASARARARKRASRRRSH